ncbi:MAG: glycine cleavage system aminomethyltransferase GcvT [Oscillospiraceae bacterium]
MEKKTPLYENHLAAGGKMVPFAGYSLPVQYPAGVLAEHRVVREKAGLFDVSHMGEVLLSGSGAMPFLQRLLTNDMHSLAVGGCRYSPMCNVQGGVVDDLIVYRLDEDRFWLVVNAANGEKDFAWMQKHAGEGAVLEDVSDAVAQLALQGPLAEGILAKLVPGGAAGLPQRPYTFLQGVPVAEASCLVSRTGYTGEDGFELYAAPQDAPALWDAVLAAGKDGGLMPCGLGARDTLRLEAGMPLYGHEMDEDITPLEAGLGGFVKLAKPDFIGRAALAAAPPARRRAGLQMTGRGIAREGAEVFGPGGQKVGQVTSGTQLPYVGFAGAMALLQLEHTAPGTQLEVDVRGRRVAAQVVEMPFYKRKR